MTKAAGVAHEMGAPLNVIKGRVEMLRERPDSPIENRARNLEIIGAQADAKNGRAIEVSNSPGISDRLSLHSRLIIPFNSSAIARP